MAGLKSPQLRIFTGATRVTRVVFAGEESRDGGGRSCSTAGSCWRRTTTGSCWRRRTMTIPPPRPLHDEYATQPTRPRTTMMPSRLHGIPCHATRECRGDGRAWQGTPAALPHTTALRQNDPPPRRTVVFGEESRDGGGRSCSTTGSCWRRAMIHD